MICFNKIRENEEMLNVKMLKVHDELTVMIFKHCEVDRVCYFVDVSTTADVLLTVKSICFNM